MEAKEYAADLKHVARPRSFSGDPQLFREWKFSFENYMLLLDAVYLTAMTTAEQSVTAIMLVEDKPETAKRAVTLFAVIASLTTSRASRLVQGVKTRNGFEVWRQLNAEFAPKVNTRKLGMLSSILAPSFAQDQSAYVWRDHFQK